MNRIILTNQYFDKDENGTIHNWCLFGQRLSKRRERDGMACTMKSSYLISQMLIYKTQMYRAIAICIV